MAGLAPGGHSPVLTLSMMGISALIIGSIINPLAGLVPLFGMGCLMTAVFMGYFGGTPTDRSLARPASWSHPPTVMSCFSRRERATGRRPSKQEMESGRCQSDPVTGDWYPEPLDDPLSLATEQRFEPVPAGEEAPTDVWRMAVFMSPLDVHVNRAPVLGASNALNIERAKGCVAALPTRLHQRERTQRACPLRSPIGQRPTH